ncbi:MAG TPA: gamma-glutamyltransferase [Thermoanaerobaculia bacterium]|nr:gamma-glutamyltransferase [Thermoanaerobaculia bacterium]
MKKLLLVLLLADTALAGSSVVASKAALSTVSPAATQVGVAVMKRGGNAIDAAVAVSFALAVTHPEAGNIGGGGFLVFYEAKTKSVWTLDYREIAPGAAKRDMYVQADGNPSKASQTGPLAGGVPGAVAGLELMHDRFGSRPWRELIEPAVRIARDGYIVDKELAEDLATEKRDRQIDQFASTAAIFYPNGQPLAAGAKLVQKDLAGTLDRIAALGAKEFYEGETAKRFVEAIRDAGGIIGYRDLREYKPVWRAPIAIKFGDYELFTMAPPSAGGLILGETLNILSGYDLAAAGFQTPRALHLEIEAERRAYIDRNKYLGDPATTRIPYRELLSEERAKAWRATIKTNAVTPTVSLAEPGSVVAESNHTTHFTIIDPQGNIVSLTTTLNDNFGSGYIVPGCGFFLNDEMDDFTTAPGKPNLYGLIQSAANAIEPGKRMASSMSPTIVLKGGKPFLALGTRGGATIPTSVLQVFLNVVIYNKSLLEAVAAPRWHHQGLPEELFFEKGLAPQATVDGLSAMGHSVKQREPIGDIHAIQILNGKIVAVADPRHGGAAGGY